MKRISALLLLVFLTTLTMAQRVSIQTGKKASAREQYAAEYLQKKLTEMGYTVSPKKADCKIMLSNANSGTAEGYTIAKDKKGIMVTGNDATGVIYGCVELADRIRQAGGLARVSSMAAWNWQTASVKLADLPSMLRCRRNIPFRKHPRW